MPATILLVNADEPNSADWKTFLQGQGYEVFEARNGRAALEDCLRLQPDLVLLHASLPDISGFEVCRQLKADPLNRLTPVVLIMPFSGHPDLSCRRDASADDFWDKPASRWEVLNRVQSILQLKSCIEKQAEAVLLSLALSIESKDRMTAGHSERIAQYAAQLGDILGLSEEDLNVLRVASLVHDIGKIAVPDSILFKPDRLNSDEAVVIRRHPVVGESICAPMKSFRHVLPIIRHHHERMNGSGYPDGLEGESIPLLARILQIADIYDALTTDRPYRRALSPECAMAVLFQEAGGGLLDQELVTHFSHISRSIVPGRSRPRSMLADYMLQ